MAEEICIERGCTQAADERSGLCPAHSAAWQKTVERVEGIPYPPMPPAEPARFPAWHDVTQPYFALRGTITTAKGQKNNGEKIRLELISPIFLEELGKVLTLGEAKYAADNWAIGLSWREVLGAALRHVLAFVGGEDRDSETGLCHLSHAACEIMFAVHFYHTRTGTDDRPAWVRAADRTFEWLPKLREIRARKAGVK